MGFLALRIVKSILRAKKAKKGKACSTADMHRLSRSSLKTIAGADSSQP